MISKLSVPWIIVTDLDGTLLDHITYDHSPAIEALQLIDQLNIPLIFNSSKTAAEISEFCHLLNNQQPFVVENGGGIYIPNSSHAAAEQITLGVEYAAILATLNNLREQGYKFSGFHDLTPQQISQQTGLDVPSAELAQQRQFSEPILWQDDEARWPTFCNELSDAGLVATLGGRFISIAGKSDKGKATAWLVRYFTANDGTPPQTIILGDGENDRTMLEQADIAVIIPNTHHAAIQLENSKQYIAAHDGPTGWNRCMIDIINKHIRK